MPTPYSEFEWDEYNSGKNLQKHGVFDEEIEQVFENPNVLMKHKRYPDRRIVLGITNGGRYLFLSVQYLSQTCCRPIHARDMEPQESRHDTRMIHGKRR